MNCQFIQDQLTKLVLITSNEFYKSKPHFLSNFHKNFKIKNDEITQSYSILVAAVVALAAVKRLKQLQLQNCSYSI